METGEILDGYDWERKILGKSSSDISSKVIHLIKRRTRFKKAVKFVKQIQPMLDWDPKNPSTEIAAIIYKTIAASLNRHASGLCFYSAVGTILDYKYSTDCFFCLELGNRESIVTVDLTISKNKYSKADIVISIDDVRNDKFYEIARKIAQILLEKMYRKINRRRRNKTEKYKKKYRFK